MRKAKPYGSWAFFPLLPVMDENFDAGVILIIALWYRGCPHTRRPYVAKVPKI
jgi:hypothetical protein